MATPRLTTFHAFPSIDGFSNVFKDYRRLDEPWFHEMSYRAKVKIHGTNAAVRVAPDKIITAQKRTSDVTIEADNAGFAAWVKSTEDFWKSTARTDLDTTLYIYGEWAGPSVQKKVAVSQIPQKHFFIFGVMMSDGSWEANPDRIVNLLLSGGGTLPDNCYVMPWYCGHSREQWAMKPLEWTVDFDAPSAMVPMIAEWNLLVQQIDAEDPYIRDLFGITGVGEGLVFYPDEPCYGFDFPGTMDPRWMFKVKGEAHGEKGASKVARIRQFASTDAIEFTKTWVTPARCLQGLQAVCGIECSHPPDMRSMGAFLKWIGNDILKEAADELEELAARDITWKNLSSGVSQMAAEWYKGRFNELTAAAA